MNFIAYIKLQDHVYKIQITCLLIHIQTTDPLILEQPDGSLVVLCSSDGTFYFISSLDGHSWNTTRSIPYRNGILT